MGLFFNTFVAAFSCLGALLFGYDSGVITEVIAMNQFTNRFHPSDTILGAIVSTFAGGCFFGAAGAGWCNDKFGRKRTIQIGCVFALWGCGMQTGANNMATLLIGRIIAGFAIGCLSMTVPLYNTEIAPAKIRGFMVGMNQQMIAIGFILANWIGYGSSHMAQDSDGAWRLPLGFQMVPALFLLVGIQFLPYSPRWLLEVGREEEARAVVYRLHGGASPEKKAFAEAEFEEMREAILAEKYTRARSIKALWATKAMTHRTAVACGVQIFGQFTGINVISYFGPLMYKGLGLSTGQALLAQGIYSAIGAVAVFISIAFVMDRVGRKLLLQWGAMSFVVTFSILSAIVASFPPGENSHHSAQLAGVAMIFLTCINFSLSFGPVSWVLASEVFPTSTRAIGTAVATCSNWAFNVMISQVSPIGLTNVGWKFYIVFVVLNFVDFFIITLVFPETKGKSLEEMAVIFGDQVDAKKVLDEHVDGDKLSDTEKASA